MDTEAPDGYVMIGLCRDEMLAMMESLLMVRSERADALLERLAESLRQPVTEPEPVIREPRDAGMVRWTY